MSNEERGIIMESMKEIDKRIQNLKAIENHDDQIIKIIEDFLELFPVSDVEMYRYSPIGFLTEGVTAFYPNTGLVQIRHVRDDVRTVPAAYKAARNRKATMVVGEDLVKHNHRYTLSPATSFLLFVPICFRSSVVGFIASTQFKVNKEEIKSMLPTFTYYGELVGNVFENPYLENNHSTSLNEREIEIMQLLSLGEKTTSISEVINLSEFTIKDYIKSSLKKLGVNNRTHAIAKLIRLGIIS